MNWSDVLSGDSTRAAGPAFTGRPHPARQTRRVLGVAGASCFASLVWVISAEAETPVSYDVTAALQPPTSLLVSTAPGLTLTGGATPASPAPAETGPGETAPAQTGPAPTSAPATTTQAPAPTQAPAQTAAPAPTGPAPTGPAPTGPAPTTAPPDGGGGHDDHGGSVITIPPTSNGTFDTSSGGS